MAPDPDAALMVAFQGGDEAACRALFEKHGRATMAFCQRFVKDAARAEELAQDVFLKLHQSADRYQPSARFTTFLYRIATNHCLNEVRRGEYQARPEIDPDSEDDVLALPRRLDLHTLVEDELLLGLPLVPMHETAAECGAVAAALDEVGDEAAADEKQKPFANLRQLLDKGAG